MPLFFRLGALTDAIITQHASLAGIAQQLAEIYYIGRTLSRIPTLGHVTVDLPSIFSFWYKFSFFCKKVTQCAKNFEYSSIVKNFRRELSVGWCCVVLTSSIFRSALVQFCEQIRVIVGAWSRSKSQGFIICKGC